MPCRAFRPDVPLMQRFGPEGPPTVLIETRRSGFSRDSEQDSSLKALLQYQKTVIQIGQDLLKTDQPVLSGRREFAVLITRSCNSIASLMTRL